MTDVTLALALLAVAVLLLIAEFFIPSYGTLAVMALAAAVGSLFFAFRVGTGTGTLFLAVIAIGLPAMLAIGVKLWPHTPIGRLILIPLPERADDVLPDTEEYRGLKSLVGRRGVAKSMMLLAGDVTIDRRTYDAVSESVPIEPGQTIKVVAVRMNRLVVRPVDPSEPDESLPHADLADPSQSAPLSRVVEDPFAENA